MSRPPKAIATTREELIVLLQQLDEKLTHPQKIIILGGASILLLGFRQRATRDIDVAPEGDAKKFQNLCDSLNIDVDIITMSSTVDFQNVHRIPVFSGKNLMVESVTGADLIKLKLERFRKHDPEDIYAIIEKMKLPFENFFSLVREMIPDFIGDTKILVLSAQIVVERMYPGRETEFVALQF